MNRRGTAMQLVIVAMAVLGAGGLVLSARLNGEIAARPEDEVRIQALWLGRSALQAGVRGERSVETPHGLARVRVTTDGGSTLVLVELGGSRAELRSSPYRESFTPPP